MQTYDFGSLISFEIHWQPEISCENMILTVNKNKSGFKKENKINNLFIKATLANKLSFPLIWMN